jgi:soluble lytic murein transglycosylase-like protein
VSIGLGGLADAQARIVQIQARISSVSPTPTSASNVPEAAAAPEPAFAQALTAVPARSAAGPVTLPTAGAAVTETSTLGTSGTLGASGTVATPAGTAVAGAELGAWASRLPAAGQRWAGAIDQAAREAGVDPALLAALVRHESNFDPNVRSHAGAIGLAQLMPGTAAGLGVDPTDPLQNLQGGARYLREQLDRFGTPELALAAYNAGPNRVAQAGGIPRITETQTYVRRVLDTWEQLR